MTILGEEYEYLDCHHAFLLSVSVSLAHADCLDVTGEQVLLL